MRLNEILPFMTELWRTVSRLPTFGPHDLSLTLTVPPPVPPPPPRGTGSRAYEGRERGGVSETNHYTHTVQWRLGAVTNKTNCGCESGARDPASTDTLGRW